MRLPHSHQLQANAVPTIFWVLGFLLLPENSAHLRAVVAEAQQAAQEGVGSEAGGQEPAPLPTAEQLGGLVALAGDRRSRVAAAVSEALRLRCFSIDVRIAAADGVLPGGTDGSGPGIWVQQGDVVAISPYESHLDARLYCPTPSPLDAFDPGRPGMRLGGSSEQHAAVAGLGGLPGLAFGGGKYR